MAKIKICGFSRQKEIEAVNELLPDYIGFVFVESSRRYIDKETARKLKKNLAPSIKAVGVFVNEDLDKVIDLCNSNIIDIVQLHGDEEEDYIKILKGQIPNQIVKAVRVKCTEDILKANGSVCDYLLLDSYIENEYGGSGKSFDWSFIPDISKPFFLAGGIKTNNVMTAMKVCHPYGIDVSSGVELDGYKDPIKMREIISKIRSVR